MLTVDVGVTVLDVVCSPQPAKLVSSKMVVKINVTCFFIVIVPFIKYLFDISYLYFLLFFSYREILYQ